METINTKRHHIYQRIILRLNGNPNNIEVLNDVDFRELFRLYDELFFHGELIKSISPKTLTIKFGKMKLAAGSCQKKSNTYTITLSKPVLTSVFSSPNSNTVETNAGLQVYDQLSCLQLTFEHELIHLLIHLRKVKEPSHGAHFKKLAKDIFGHTDFRHTLGRGLEEDPAIHNNRVRSYLRVGLIVSVYNPKTKETETYEVIEIPKRKDAKRFVGRYDGKTYKIPFVHVMLP